MMKKRSMALLIVPVLAIGVSAGGALIAYEGFDYSAGDLGGQNGGAGWTGAWSGGSNYAVVANSLNMPNLPFAPIGGSAVGHSNANRVFADGIDFSKEGTYYASFLVQRTGWGASDGGGEWFDFHFRTSGYTDAALAGISSTEKFEVRIASDSVAQAGDAATMETCFLVSKIVTHESAADEIYLKAYFGSDMVDLSETTGWTVAGTTSNIDLLASMVTLWAGTDNDADGLYQAAIDEIRIGTTWEDVVPVERESDLVVYEGFNYSAGSLNGRNGGLGWSDAWSSGDHYDVAADSLTHPWLPFVPLAGAVVGQNTGNRNFPGIDFSQEGTYFIGFLVRRTGWSGSDGSGEWFDFHLRDSANNSIATVGISSAEKFEVRYTTNAFIRTAGSQAATTNACFMVAKIVTHASAPDEIYLNAYLENDRIDIAEPAGWTLVGGTAEINALADKITLWAGTDNDADGLYQARFDELRIGTTWDDVLPTPPECSLMFERLP